MSFSALAQNESDLRSCLRSTARVLEKRGRDIARIQREGRKKDRRIEELELKLGAELREKYRDPLTGTLNRKFYDEELAKYVKAMAEKGQYLAMAVIDADTFKLVNDKAGHAAGDSVLQRLAQVIHENLRPNDPVISVRADHPSVPPGADPLIRYGGEEFVVILQGATAEEAGAAMERVRQAVENDPALRHLVAGVKGAQTVSIGVASLAPAPALTPEQAQAKCEELFKRADDQAYLAKRNGKARDQALTPEDETRGRNQVRIDKTPVK
jgi:GGDEF domain-containing protein